MINIIYNNMNTNNPKSQAGNVKVFCRFRPFNVHQLESGTIQSVQKIISDKHLVIKDPYKDDQLTFLYDKIFDSQATQQQVYNQVGAPILENILDGFNGTIIAYGQTSSGKTHTIQGINNDPKNKGIIPRLIQNLFLAIQNSSPSIEFKLKVSFLQLYMEKLYDLIDCRKSDLKIRESKNQGPYVQGKTQVYISDKYQLTRLMNVAQKNRVTCSTNMNNTSSRSHLIFHLTLSQFNSQTQQAKVSNLFIVDLAGSQKVSKTGAEGKILQQAKKINLSLASLAKVIKSLSQKIHHIPYRDSKLTRIIQDALGGNSKTTLILNCSPSELNICQTVSTLRFGETAQKIKNKPKINREPTIKELKNIIIRLQAKIKIKEHWIAILEAHIRQKLGISLPRKQLLKKYSNDRLFSITTLDNNIPSNLSFNNIDQEYNPQLHLSQNIRINFDKYLNQSLRIPQLDLNSRLHSYLNQPLNERFSTSELIDHIGQWQSHSDSAENERIVNLENQLAICKANLNQQISKHNALRKQHNTINQSMKSILQQNINYQVKISELQELLKSVGLNYNLIVNNHNVKNIQEASQDMLISEEQQEQVTKYEYKQTQLKASNDINAGIDHSRKSNKNNQNHAQKLCESRQISSSIVQQLRQSVNMKKSYMEQSTGQSSSKIRQQNQILLKLCQQLKAEKQMLQVKIKSKERKVEELKSMMEQIQQQMQLMAEQYDQPINISFNTKIANPINRSPLNCE